MLNIRKTKSDDTENLDAMLHRAFHELLVADYSADILAVAVPLMGKSRPELVTCGTYFLVENDVGEVLDAGGWTADDPETGKPTQGIGHIRHFGVDPDAVRKGVAGLIMNRVLDECRIAGIKYLSCLSTLSAVRFYQAQGFEVQESRNVALGPQIKFPSVQMKMVLT